MTMADNVLGLLGVGRIDFFILLRDISWPGGLRGAIESTEASFEALWRVTGFSAAGTSKRTLKLPLLKKRVFTLSSSSGLASQIFQNFTLAETPLPFWC